MTHFLGRYTLCGGGSLPRRTARPSHGRRCRCRGRGCFSKGWCVLFLWPVSIKMADYFRNRTHLSLLHAIPRSLLLWPVRQRSAVPAQQGRCQAGLQTDSESSQPRPTSVFSRRVPVATARWSPSPPGCPRRRVPPMQTRYSPHRPPLPRCRCRDGCRGGSGLH